MPKAKTPSFILELRISFSDSLLRNRKPKAGKCPPPCFFDRRFKVANKIYNTALNNSLSRMRRLIHDKEYIYACEGYKRAVSEDDTKAQNFYGEVIARTRDKYGYSEYSLHKYIIGCKHHFDGLFGIDECQKLATRAYKAVEKMRSGYAGKVRFHKADDNIAIEGKSKKSALKYAGDLCIQFGRGNIFPLKVKKNDHYAYEALKNRVKYVRVVRKVIRGKYEYFAQLVMEGVPPQKHPYGEDKPVGLDEGVSTIAVSSRDEVRLYELAPECSIDEKEMRRINRAIDRSVRSTNPDNYNEDGTVKKGCLMWNESKRCRTLKARRRECYRRLACRRKIAHEKLANHIVSLGTDIRVEPMAIKALAKKSRKQTKRKRDGKINSKKRYGRTILSRAPAMLVSTINRKLSYIDKSVKKIDSFKVKASQYDHRSDRFRKKTLSERWHYFRKPKEGAKADKVQRDLYSAFLICNTNDELDHVDRVSCKKNYRRFKKLHDDEIDRIKKMAREMTSEGLALKWYIS